MIPIHQFIYTKVQPDLSPFKKAGFHALFYPLDFLDKKNLLEIESCLHFPGGDIFDAKRICLFKKIKNETFQILIYLKSLPDAKDEFGRTGIFLAHGFFLPPQLWQNTGNLFWGDEILRQHLVSDNVSALESPLANKETGDIRPILWDEDAMVFNNAPAPELNENERKLTIALVKIANQKIDDGAITLKGTPKQVEEQLERCFYYLPNEIKAQLGFDSGFDGGKIFFFPLKVVGYSKNPPTTGNPLQYDGIHYSFGQHEKENQYLFPSTLFERWIIGCNAGFDTPSEPNRIHQIVRFLEQQTDVLPANATLPSEFITANEALIKDIFVKNAPAHLPPDWVTVLTNRSYPEKFAQVLMSHFDPKNVADLIQTVILQEQVPASKFTNHLPKKITDEAGTALQVIFSAWRNENPTYNQITQLTSEEQFQLYDYQIKTSHFNSDGIFQVWMRIPHVASIIYDDSDQKTRDLLNNSLKKQLEKDFNKELAPVISKELITQKKVTDYFNQSWKVADILETALHAGRCDKKELKKIYAYAKDHTAIIQNYWFLQSLVQPSLLQEKLNALEGEQRKRILDALMVTHSKLTKKQLLQLGFKDREIISSLEKNKKSLIDTIKGIFGL